MDLHRALDASTALPSTQKWKHYHHTDVYMTWVRIHTIQTHSSHNCVVDVLLFDDAGALRDHLIPTILFSVNDRHFNNNSKVPQPQHRHIAFNIFSHSHRRQTHSHSHTLRTSTYRATAHIGQHWVTFSFATHNKYSVDTTLHAMMRIYINIQRCVHSTSSIHIHSADTSSVYRVQMTLENSMSFGSLFSHQNEISKQTDVFPYTPTKERLTHSVLNILIKNINRQ